MTISHFKILKIKQRQHKLTLALVPNPGYFGSEFITSYFYNEVDIYIAKKTDFCLCKKTNVPISFAVTEADQCLCFRYTIALLSRAKISSL